MPPVDPQWTLFWRNLSRFGRLLPAGFLAAFLPTLFHWFSGSRGEALLQSLVSALVYGTVVGLFVVSINAAFYAVVVTIRVKSGMVLRVPPHVQVLVVLTGIFLGVAASMSLSAKLLGMPAVGPAVLPVVAFTIALTAAFSMYVLYRRAVEETLEMKRALAQARCRALEAGMQPHFLFNALNSLAELIDGGDSRQASEMTMKLSELYRSILLISERRTVPLSVELKLAGTFLEIEQIRLGPRLSFRILNRVAGDPLVPGLVLQTLVENAVKHGIRPCLPGGEVTVTVENEAHGWLRATVTNTGEPWPGVVREGFGLSNTRERLSLLYGSRHQFSAGRRESDGATVVSFLAPVEVTE